MTVKAYRTDFARQFAVDVNVCAIQCADCGCAFCIPQTLERAARNDPKTSFYCPFGHSNYYPGTTIERRLELARDQLAATRALHDQTKASLKAQKAAAKRARNERDRAKAVVAEGICPVPGCRQGFKNLASHMAHEHPDYGEREHLPREDMGEE